MSDMYTRYVSEIAARYADPAVAGALGAKIEGQGEGPTADGIGRRRAYARGEIHHHPALGTHYVLDPIRARWTALRRERGFLGHLAGDPVYDPASAQWSNEFQGGRIEWRPDQPQIQTHRVPRLHEPVYVVPVVFLAVADDDGSRPTPMTDSAADRWLGESNYVFSVAGVRFERRGPVLELRSSAVNSVLGDGKPNPNQNAINALLMAQAVQHRAVIIAVRSAGGGFSSGESPYVAMPPPDIPFDGWLTPHELGHYFGLQHTFPDPVFTSVAAAEAWVLATGVGPEYFDGDAGSIHDTPGHPHIENYAFKADTSTTSIVLAGTAYALGRSNAMSYWYPSAGLPLFTHDQVDKIRLTLRSRAAAATPGLDVVEELSLLDQLIDIGEHLEHLIHGPRPDEWGLALLRLEVLREVGMPDTPVVARALGPDRARTDVVWSLDAEALRAAADGRSVRALDVVEHDGETRFAVALGDPERPQHLLVGVIAAELADGAGSGRRVVALGMTATARGPLYAAAVADDDRGGAELVMGGDVRSLPEVVTEHAARGLVVDHLATAHIGADDAYAVSFVKGDVTQQILLNLTGAGLRAALAGNDGAPARLAALGTACDGREIRYNAVLEPALPHGGGPAS